MSIIIRRKRLGFTSVKAICDNSTSGIKWIRNDEENCPVDDLYIRWGCTSSVPTKKVINSAEAIHRVNDKRKFRLLLDKESLCPKTWGTINDVPKNVNFPLIVRKHIHAQGRYLHVCNNFLELKTACAKYDMEQYYIAEYIKKVAEYRVFISQGRVVWVASKTPGDLEQAAWNVAKGGTFNNVRWGDWPLNVCEAAIQAWDLSELHFGGVDVIVDPQGYATVLEINSAPSLTSPYRQACTAKAFDWSATVSQDRKAMKFNVNKGWKGFIHPAVSDVASDVELVHAGPKKPEKKDIGVI